MSRDLAETTEEIVDPKYRPVVKVAKWGFLIVAAIVASIVVGVNWLDSRIAAASMAAAPAAGAGLSSHAAADDVIHARTEAAIAEHERRLERVDEKLDRILEGIGDIRGDLRNRRSR